MDIMSHILISPTELVALEECENTSKKSVLSIKECITNFSETSVGDSVVTVSSIHEVWEKVVGEQVAEHVQVRHLKDSVLSVVADHSAWKTQLKYMNQQIINDINEHLGEDKVKSISLSVR